MNESNEETCVKGKGCQSWNYKYKVKKSLKSQKYKKNPVHSICCDSSNLICSQIKWDILNVFVPNYGKYLRRSIIIFKFVLNVGRYSTIGSMFDSNIFRSQGFVFFYVYYKLQLWHNYGYIKYIKHWNYV